MIDVTMNKRDECWWADGCDPSVFLGDAICRAAKRRVDGLPDGKYRVRIEPADGAAVETCRACGKELVLRNVSLADCCPCNAGRGVNHGLVPESCCTCEICDPRQTGLSRCKFPIPKPQVVQWPWPDVTRVKVCPARSNQTRLVLIEVSGADWAEAFRIPMDSLGEWNRDDVRIATRGPNNEVVLTEEK